MGGRRGGVRLGEGGEKGSRVRENARTGGREERRTVEDGGGEGRGQEVTGRGEQHTTPFDIISRTHTTPRSRLLACFLSFSLSLFLPPSPSSLPPALKYVCWG